MPVQWTAAMISPVEDLDGAPLLRTEVVLDEGHGDVTEAQLARHRPGCLRGEPERPRGRRRRAQPGLVQLRVAAALPQLRRHRRCSERPAPVVLGLALGNGWYRGRLDLERRARRCTATGSAPSPQLEITYADGHQQIVVTDDVLDRRPVRTCSPTTSTTARPSMPGCRRRRLAAARASPTRPGPASRSLDFDTDLLAPYVGPAGGPPRGAAPGRRSGPRRRGQTLVDFGQNLVGWLQFARPRRGRPARSPSGTPRCSSTASSASGRCAPPRRPTVHPERRRRRLRADASPSTASATPRSTGWPGELTADDLVAVVVALRPARGPATSSAPTSCSTSCTATWSGASGATSSTCRPTARSATSGWAGPVTSRSSPRPRRSCSTSTASSATGCVDLAAEQRARRRHGAVRRPRRAEVRPDQGVRRRARLHRDLERRGGLGAVGAVAGVRRPGRCSRRVPGRWPRTCAGSSRKLSPNGLWDTGFQFGDWLDPTAPPDDPVRRQGRQGRGGDRLPLPQRAIAAPRPPRCSAATDDAAAVRRPGRAARATRSTSTTCTTTAAIAERLPHRLRPGDRLRPAGRGRSAARPATGSPSWSPRTATTSPPGSPARRTSPTR